MAQFEIKDVEFMEFQGYPSMRLKIDGQEAYVDSEQKRLRKSGLAFIGRQFDDVFGPKIIPPDPAVGGTREDVMYGFTDDPDLVRLVEYYVRQVKNGTFETGRVDLGKLFP